MEFLKKKGTIKVVLVLLLAVIMALVGTACGSADSKTAEPAQTKGNVEATQAVKKPTSKPAPTEPMKVYYIDVGQADCILITTPDDKTMLIDAGNNADGDHVVNYIRNQGISKIDVLVGTHPHEDHIGGMDDVIQNFSIGKFYMPKVAHTTQTYEDVLDAAQSKGMKIIAGKAGMSIPLSDVVSAKIEAPNSSQYDDLNNYSIVLKLTYKNNSFLFTGDAEDVSEKEMLYAGNDISADVLKIGHHGSSSSTTRSFLNAVSPEYAVICVGAGNDYNHPSQETIGKLKNGDIPVYRTDECGTVIASCDGEQIIFNCQPGSYSYAYVAPPKSATSPTKKDVAPAKSGFGGSGTTSSSRKSGSSSNSSSPDFSNSNGSVTTSEKPSSEKGRIVYWTPNGKSYHYSRDCATLKRSKIVHSGTLNSCPKDDPCNVCAR